MSQPQKITLEYIAANMATKEYIAANIVTKEYIAANMATKEYIAANMATKQDLKDLAAKLATKKDLNTAKQEILDSIGDTMQVHIDHVDKRFDAVHTEVKAARKDLRVKIDSDIYHDDQNELRRRVTKLEKAELNR